MHATISLLHSLRASLTGVSAPNAFSPNRLINNNPGPPAKNSKFETGTCDLVKSGARLKERRLVGKSIINVILLDVLQD